jgi:hypothetical protein
MHQNASESQHKASYLQPSFSPVAYPATLSAILTALSEDLGFKFNESTVKTRWIPDRFFPAIKDLSLPSAIKTESGKWEKLGHELLGQYLWVCVVSPGKVSWEEWREQLIERYPDPLRQTKEETDVAAAGQLVILSEIEKARLELLEVDKQENIWKERAKADNELRELKRQIQEKRENVAFVRQTLEAQQRREDQERREQEILRGNV